MSTIPLRNNTFHQYFLQKTVISKAGHRSFNSRPVISEAKRRPAGDPVGSQHPVEERHIHLNKSNEVVRILSIHNKSFVDYHQNALKCSESSAHRADKQNTLRTEIKNTTLSTLVGQQFLWSIVE